MCICVYTQMHAHMHAYTYKISNKTNLQLLNYGQEFMHRHIDVLCNILYIRGDLEITSIKIVSVLQAFMAHQYHKT